MARVLSLLCAARVAYALSPPIAAWWREQWRRLHGRPRNPEPPRACPKTTT